MDLGQVLLLSILMHNPHANNFSTHHIWAYHLWYYYSMCKVHALITNSVPRTGLGRGLSIPQQNIDLRIILPQLPYRVWLSNRAWAPDSTKGVTLPHYLLNSVLAGTSHLSISWAVWAHVCMQFSTLNPFWPSLQTVLLHIVREY